MQNELLDPIETEEVDKPLRRSEYNIVQVNYKSLTREQQDILCKELSDLAVSFQCLVYNIPECQRLLVEEYESRSQMLDGVYLSPSLAKLGADYNTSLKGKNSEIKQRVEFAFYKIKEVMDSNPIKVLDYFLYAKLSYKYYYSPKIIEFIRNSKLTQAKEALEIYNRIEALRIELMNGVINIVVDIVRGMNPDKNDIADLLQEGMIAAYDATMMFDVEHDGQAKWSSYAYIKISNEISRYISETARIVSVPRYMQDRSYAVGQALKLLGGSDFELLAKLATKLLSEKLDRKLDKSEVYTSEEAEALANYIQNSVSLDSPTNYNPDSNVVEGISNNRIMNIRETLATSDISIETRVEQRSISDKLQEILKEKLTTEQWDVLSIRWGFESGAPCGLDETTMIYKRKYPDRKINKTRVNQIEEKVRGMLKADKDSRLLELHSAAESLILQRGGN